MKKLSKFFISFAIIIVIFQICNIAFVVLVPEVFAQSAEEAFLEKMVEPKIKIPFPGINLDVSKSAIKVITATKEIENCRYIKEGFCVTIPWIGNYLAAAYKYALVIGSLVATLMMIIGGLMYVLAGMNPSLISKAKGYMTGSVMGLVLLLSSYVLLNTINPNLVKLQPLEIELFKAQGVHVDKYCYEYDTTKYDVTDAPCGRSGHYKSKDVIREDEGSCFGSVCSKDANSRPMTCIPTNPDTPYDNVKKCADVAVWGYIENPPGRYLDEIAVFSLEGLSDPDCVAQSGNGATDFPTYQNCPVSIGNVKDYFGPEQKMYAILWSELMGKVNAGKQDFLLGIQINDSGASRAAVTNAKWDDGVQAGMNWMGVGGTIDDEYLVALDKRNPISLTPHKEIWNGIWIGPCNAAAVVTYPLSSGWFTQVDNTKKEWDAMDAYDLSKDGIRVDLDLSNFREDTSVNCSGVKGVGTPTKKIGEVCGANNECISNDCESEQDVQMCECNDDADCAREGIKDAFCQKSVYTWNQCVKRKKLGEACDSTNKCVDGAKCDGGTCKCATKDACNDPSEICYKDATSCVDGKDNLQNNCKSTSTPKVDICEQGNFCHGSKYLEEGSAEERCECRVSKVEHPFTGIKIWGDSCPRGQKCIQVAEGCGWNYCIDENETVATVAKDTKFSLLDYTKDPAKTGLCFPAQTNIDPCGKSAVCTSGWAPGGCAACKAKP